MSIPCSSCCASAFSCAVFNTIVPFFIGGAFDIVIVDPIAGVGEELSPILSSRNIIKYSTHKYTNTNNFDVNILIL